MRRSRCAEARVSPTGNDNALCFHSNIGPENDMAIMFPLYCWHWKWQIVILDLKRCRPENDKLYVGLDARKTAFGGLRTTKAQTSLRIHAAWSVPLLFAYGKCYILTCYERNFDFEASLCSSADRFESYFGGNPEDRFSHSEAHIYFGKPVLTSWKITRPPQPAFNIESQLAWWKQAWRNSLDLS